MLKKKTFFILLRQNKSGSCQKQNKMRKTISGESPKKDSLKYFIDFFLVINYSQTFGDINKGENKLKFSFMETKISPSLPQRSFKVLRFRLKIAFNNLYHRNSAVSFDVCAFWQMLYD